MAFWIFKYNPEIYRIDERLTDPNPLITWTVSRYREEISPGDTAFIWETGKRRGIRAVLRVDEAPKDMPEIESEQKYWGEADHSIRPRVLGTITHRNVNLLAEYLRGITKLEDLYVFHGFQQGTNFPVTFEEGRVLMELIEKGEKSSKTDTPKVFNPKEKLSVDKAPTFEIGRT